MLPNNFNEPMGAPAIFEKQIEIPDQGFSFEFTPSDTNPRPAFTCFANNGMDPTTMHDPIQTEAM
ncbi:MAG: hypothetical protein P8X89_19810 [Reinekea sp.]